MKSALKSTSRSASFLPALFLTHHFLVSKWMAVSKLKGSRSCENNRPRKRIFNFPSISLMMKPVLNIKRVLRVEHQEQLKVLLLSEMWAEFLYNLFQLGIQTQLKFFWTSLGRPCCVVTMSLSLDLPMASQLNSVSAFSLQRVGGFSI